MNVLKRLFTEEEGQGMVEYALIIGLISIAAITLLGPIGDKIAEWFGKLSSEMGITTTKE